MMKKTVLFKYKSSYFFNMVALMFFILFIISTIIIIKYVKANNMRIIWILIIAILIFIWMNLVAKKLCVLNGKFSFSKDILTYDTLSKTYEIEYQEIEYIIKEKLMDYTSFFNIENYQYRLKIKNAGSFRFVYFNESLDEAMKALSSISKISIEDETK